MVLTLAVLSELAELGPARDLVVRATDEWHVPIDRCLIELLLSEVLSNAMEHGEPPIAVTVDWDGERLRVAVADGSPRVPVHRVPSAHDVDGRGIWLLERSASAWGVEPTGAGKSVWFELSPSASDLG